MKKTTTLLLVAFVATLFAFQWGIKINQEDFQTNEFWWSGSRKNRRSWGNQTVLLVMLVLLWMVQM